MSRERVIKDFKTLEDAEKVENTVKTGYCDPIKESLMLWIAVEEDMIDSYTRLSKGLGPKGAQRVGELVAESRNTIEILRENLKSFELLGERTTRRVRDVKELQRGGS